MAWTSTRGWASEPAAAAAAGLTTFDPTAAIKSDPNSMEAASPAAATAPFYTYTFDAQTERLTADGMLCYALELTDFDLSTSFSIMVVLQCKAGSVIDLLGGVALSSSSTLSGANGVACLVNEDTAGVHEAQTRLLNQAWTDSTGVTSAPALVVLQIVHTPQRDTVNGWCLDGTGPTAYGTNLSFANDTTPSTTGSPWLCVLLGCRGTPGGASETKDVAIQYLVHELG